MTDIFLGFDTSNYTTSAAIFGSGIIKSERKILDVKKGERGLRQSDALFAHVKNLPPLYRALMENTPKTIAAVGVSTRPRNVEGSYMPVFLAGSGFAHVAADTLGVPVFEFSHQDGHIMAGIVSGSHSELLEKPFLSVHLSGGTTEVLKSRYNGFCFDNEIIGGTKDISAGQLIDRVGVLLGMKFPCGRELEEKALCAEGRLKMKTSVSGGYVNFSGAETALSRLIKANPAEEICLAVLEHVGTALSKMLSELARASGIKDILIVGGVASDKIIKNILTEQVSARLFFAAPEYSADNAVGIAALAEKGYRK